MNLLTFVLRAPDEPILSRGQIHRLAKAHRAHAAYLKHRESLADSDDDNGPQDDDAWLMEDLKVLTHLYSRLRDREQLIALIFEVCILCCYNEKIGSLCFPTGFYSRAFEGYHHHILYTSGAGLPSGQHSRFS